MIVAKPHHCEEASIFSPIPGAYFPCNQPATKIILSRDGIEVAMCDMCADHNLKNRGAAAWRPYDPEGYESPIAAANAREGASPGLSKADLAGMGAYFDSLPVAPVPEPLPPRDLDAELNRVTEASRLLDWED